MAQKTSASPSCGQSRSKRPRVSRAKLNYTFSASLKEDHPGPLFGCAFRPQFLKRVDVEPDESEKFQDVFATVGSNRISVYECEADNKSIKPLQAYSDPDKEEVFYSCAWSHDSDNQPLLAAAGKRGIIRVLQVNTGACVKNFIGHGSSVNDLMFSYTDPNLLFSASKDLSIRLWNIKTDVLVAIFGGAEGHRDEVLSVDINLTSSLLISSSIDHSLKMWRIEDGVKGFIEKSYTYEPNAPRSFPTLKKNYPDFSTRKIHSNYVDCCKWYGDFVLSKSCDEKVICWKPGKCKETFDDIPRTSNDVTVITKLECADCTLWFMKFSMDFLKTKLALGNNNGKVYVYDLTSEDTKYITCSSLSHPECTATIRQTAFNRDGSILICVCDDSTVWRWDLNPNH